MMPENYTDSGTLDQIAGAALVTGVHVVIVETAAGKYRRRCFFSLAGAQKAADKAVMSGHSAQVVLCQLIPVPSGGDAL